MQTSQSDIERQVAEASQQQEEQRLARLKIPGFFPTPPAIVDQLVTLAQISDGMRVLEPSAGTGNIADKIREEHAVELDVAEISPTLREMLARKGYEPVATDVLAYNPGPIYERIVMNPAFEKGHDIDEVMHAYELLKPGGRLVAIMGQGPFFREDRKSSNFRAWFDAHDGNATNMLPAQFGRTKIATKPVILDKPQMRNEQRRTR